MIGQGPEGCLPVTNNTVIDLIDSDFSDEEQDVCEIVRVEKGKDRVELSQFIPLSTASKGSKLKTKDLLIPIQVKTVSFDKNLPFTTLPKKVRRAATEL